jgi:two-component system response regulator MprA
VRRGGKGIELTRTEYALLELLMRNPERVLTREYLIESVWGNDSEIESNTLDAFVRLLRAKIEADGARRILTTVRGVGYCLRGGTQ